MRRLAPLVIVFVAWGCARVPAGQPRCELAGGTQRWLEGSFAAWEEVRVRQLRLPAGPPPRIVVFDRYCVYAFESAGAGSTRLRAGDDTLHGQGRPHGGRVPLPDGRSIGVHGTAFASLRPGDSTSFLVLSLEDVWRSDPAHGSAGEDWSSYLRRSFVHEMTHARQLAVWVPMLQVAGRRVGLSDFDDDIIQQRFDSVPGFRESVLEETALLYDAAFAPTSAGRRALAREALGLMRLRRERVYGGTDAPWARIEQLLLDLEGAAQWAAMAHVGNSTRLTPAARREIVRGSRQYWSQEQGFALYLVLDALVPDWASHMFSASPPSSVELLEMALSTGPT